MIWKTAMGALAVCTAVLFFGFAASADVPETLSYQGVLSLNDGRMAPDGTYQVRFALYDSAVLGTLLFEETMSVGVKNGLYNVILSNQPGQTNLGSVFSSGSQRYMEVTLLSGGGLTYPTGGITFSPRQQIASVPYALQARLPAIVGQIDNQGSVAVTASAVPSGWTAVPNTAVGDNMQISITVHDAGDVFLVNYVFEVSAPGQTSPYANLSGLWVLAVDGQGGGRLMQIEGDYSGATNWGSSGTAFLTGLNPGTYQVILLHSVNDVGDRTYSGSRQLIVTQLK